MWVKICANTNLEDALLAASLGADAAGFVFAPSTRQVTPAQVREIALKLPEELARVGVFPRLAAEEIAAAARHARLHAVQLHGGFDPALTVALERLVPELTLIQTAHWNIEDHDGRSVLTALERIESSYPGSQVLIDAKVGGISGGTGRHFDWPAAAPTFAASPNLRKILAGGLRPENVAEAISTLHPWGVDVASGVESTPGKKDPVRLRAFIENARRA